MNLIKDTKTILAEYLFTLLPFIVIAIVFSSKGDFFKLFNTPDLALAASVLFGQSIIKFISGMLANKATYSAYWQNVALGVACILVIGLTPSLVVLCISLLANEMSGWMKTAQIVMFIASTAVFFIFGGAGEWLKDNS